MWILSDRSFFAVRTSPMAPLWRQIVVILAIVLTGFGCGGEEAPQDDRSLAVGTVEFARRAGAAEYAQEAFARATDELARAEAEWAAQDGKKFGFMRKYGKAKELFASAAELAEIAQQEATAQKDRMQQDLATLSTDLESRILTSQSIVDGDSWALFRDRARDPAPMMELEDELSALEESAAEMQSALADGDPQRALRIGRAALDQLEQLEPLIDEASKTGTVNYRFDK